MIQVGSLRQAWIRYWPLYVLKVIGIPATGSQSKCRVLHLRKLKLLHVMEEVFSFGKAKLAWSKLREPALVNEREGDLIATQLPDCRWSKRGASRDVYRRVNWYVEVLHLDLRMDAPQQRSHGPSFLVQSEIAYLIQLNCSP